MRRALLIGSQTFGLKGCYNDVAAMSDCLNGLGFSARCLIEGRATRGGIIESLSRLTRESKSGDAVVIYYSGHGGLVPAPDEVRAKAREMVSFQFLVPEDMSAGHQKVFRGIMTLELSRFLAELTAITNNVAVILDCCHATRMCRQRGVRARAVNPIWSEGIKTHLNSLTRVENGELRHFESNPHVVRLAACGRYESAYEYDHPRRGSHGIMTTELLSVLAACQGNGISWADLGRTVRERVLMYGNTQRPEVEGPVRRFLFQTEEKQECDAVTFFLSRQASDPFSFKPSLRGGYLTGLQPGDQYGLMPPGRSIDKPGQRTGVATVHWVGAQTARVSYEWGKGVHGAPAFPIRKALPRLPVKIWGRPEANLGKAIEQSPYLKIAEAKEPFFAMLVPSSSGYEIRDQVGEPLAWPSRVIGLAVKNLEQLARTHFLMALESGTDSAHLKADFDLELGRLQAGFPSPLTGEIPTFHNGDRIYLKLHNLSRAWLFFNVLDLGISGRVSVLNQSQPSGLEIAPGSSYELGYREFDEWVGIQLGWPESVPPHKPRKECFMVIVSDKPIDLRLLERRGIQRASQPNTSLGRMIAQIKNGGTRTVAKTTEHGGAELRYAIRRLFFVLHPQCRNVVEAVGAGGGISE